MPSYSQVLNNDKSSNLYMNSPLPYVPAGPKKGPDYHHGNHTRNGASGDSKYYRSENLYANQSEAYDEKNLYSNIGNMPAPQVPVDDRSRAATRQVVYGNIEPAVPIAIPEPIKTNKDLIYSNIQWSSKPENTYCNIPAHGGN